MSAHIVSLAEWRAAHPRQKLSPAATWLRLVFWWLSWERKP